ncbi:hypothetical protein PIB30_020837 [Stylosanthes scabra]|uniref:Uncharacterized protein n=1 Tax=Stylosanthes scabra TaxID=79078 RepID=A0ABU6U7K9_9FABA|nr:hypothetical protein [Stylosanthes scabra]
MAPRGRSRRAARAAPAPEPAEEAGQGAPAGGAPQAVESLSRLNRDYHIAGALEHYQQQSWDMVEQYLGARPPVPANAQKESFVIKMVWLRERLQHIPVDADPDTLRQYARCYIMLFIGGYLMPDKSGNLVHI